MSSGSPKGKTPAVSFWIQNISKIRMPLALLVVEVRQYLSSSLLQSAKLLLTYTYSLSIFMIGLLIPAEIIRIRQKWKLNACFNSVVANCRTRILLRKSAQFTRIQFHPNKVNLKPRAIFNVTLSLICLPCLLN